MATGVNLFVGGQHKRSGAPLDGWLFQGAHHICAQLLALVLFVRVQRVKPRTKQLEGRLERVHTVHLSALDVRKPQFMDLPEQTRVPRRGTTSKLHELAFRNPLECSFNSEFLIISTHELKRTFSFRIIPPPWAAGSRERAVR